MKPHQGPATKQRGLGRLSSWRFCAAVLLSFAAGSLVTARLMKADHAEADGDRVFELMIYHALPGKGPALESIFRDVSKLQAKHDMKVIGYWVPNEDPAWRDTFIYLVAHPSRDEENKNWKALHSDAVPAVQELGRTAYRKSQRRVSRRRSVHAAD